MSGSSAQGDAWLVEPTSKQLADDGKVVKVEEKKVVSKGGNGGNGPFGLDEEKKQLLIKVGAGVAALVAVALGVRAVQSRSDDGEYAKGYRQADKAVGESKGWFGRKKRETKEAANKVEDKADNAGGWFGRKANNAKDAVGGAANNASNNVQSATSSAGNKVGEAAHNVQHKAGEAAGAVQHAVGDAAHSVSSAVRGAKDSVEHKADKVRANAIEASEKQDAKLRAKADKAADKASNAAHKAGSKADAAKDRAKGWASRAEDEVKDENKGGCSIM